MTLYEYHRFSANSYTSDALPVQTAQGKARQGTAKQIQCQSSHPVHNMPNTTTTFGHTTAVPFSALMRAAMDNRQTWPACRCWTAKYSLGVIDRYCPLLAGLIGRLFSLHFVKIKGKGKKGKERKTTEQKESRTSERHHQQTKQETHTRRNKASKSASSGRQAGRQRVRGRENVDDIGHSIAPHGKAGTAACCMLQTGENSSAFQCQQHGRSSVAQLRVVRVT